MLLRNSIESNHFAGLVESLESRYLLSVAAGNAADAQWLIKADSGELLEIALGNMAQTSSTNADVKSLGTLLVNDHTASRLQLAQVAQSLGVTLPGTMNAHDQAVVTRLGRLSGNKFDEAFSTLEIQDHKKDILDYTRESTRAKTSQVQTFALNTIPALENHLTTAQSTESAIHLTASDKIWIQKTYSANLVEIALGTAAQTQSANAQLKSFGQTLVADHTAANQQLATIAGSLGVDVSSQMTASDQKQVAKITQLNGAAFDKAFAAFMVADHKKSVADFTRRNKASKNSQIRAFTAAQIPVLQTHLTEAQSVAAAVKGEIA